jgi:hypothetical protein
MKVIKFKHTTVQVNEFVRLSKEDRAQRYVQGLKDMIIRDGFDSISNQTWRLMLDLIEKEKFIKQ